MQLEVSPEKGCLQRPRVCHPFYELEAEWNRTKYTSSAMISMLMGI